MKGWFGVVLVCFCLVVLVSSEAVIKKRPPVIYASEWAIHLEANVDPHILTERGYEVLGQVGTLDGHFVVRHTETHAHHQKDPSHRLSPSLHVTEHLRSHNSVKWAEQQVLVKYDKRDFPDPLFPSQWHLVNTGQFNGTAGVDVSIQSAWNLGYDGTGVRIAVVDDGFQTTHPDLAPNYKSDSSWNFNSNPQQNSPDPNVTTDFHGTSASGVALAASNAVCGVGAAYNAQGAGIRLIAEPVTDATQASGLSYKNQLNHIYSNSWGPSDDGVNVGGPGPLTAKAIQNGVQTGRNGLGSIYVWAAGNGGDLGDNCNYDGFASAREVIAVAALGNNGVQSYYSEPCAALLVAAPSSSITPNAGIRTTDLVGTPGYDNSDCNSGFGGTSSACPLVAGIIALVLQANSNLTWRDVPYILATTATKTDPTDSDWVNNAAGYHVNHKYGFGRINATAAVLAAKTHVNLLPQVVSGTGLTVNKKIPDYPNSGVTATVTVTDKVIIEKVMVTVTINHPTSGDLMIKVTSPSGTESILATPHAVVPALFVGDLDPVAAGQAAFGGDVTFTPIKGKLVQASPSTACSTITNCAQLKGNIAFVWRGSCEFTTKAYAVQTCGATAMVLMNIDPSDPYDPIIMGGSDPRVTIPCVSVSQYDGQYISKYGLGSTTYLKVTQYSANNYKNGWTMSTTRLLGESAKGTWTIQVVDGFSGNTGTFNSFCLSIYGTGTSTTTNYVCPSGQSSDDTSKGLSTGAKAAIAIVVLVFIGVVMYAVFAYQKQGHLFGYTYRSGSGIVKYYERSAPYVAYTDSAL